MEAGLHQGGYYWPTSGKVTFFGYGGVATATYAKEDGKFLL